MFDDLKNFLFFLHGLSGSGKGEMYRILAEQFGEGDYSVIYASSGSLFRAAFSNPVIAEQVRRGYFVDTLGAIMPGVEEVYEQFIEEWFDRNGRTILIFDGLIRRSEFINQDGKHIPSQISQVAAGLNQANMRLIERNNKYLEILHTDRIGEFEKEASAQVIGKTIIESTHILIDVNPQDAEAQMIRRADKEIANLRTQLNATVESGRISTHKSQEIFGLLDKIECLLHGAIVLAGEGIQYTSRDQAPPKLPTELSEPFAHEVVSVRQQLAQVIGIQESSSFAAAFEALGLTTEIRDDDISSIGRQGRIANYVRPNHDPDGTYTPGIASQALIDGLSYQFELTGSFRSGRENCRVIANGTGRGIGLDEFRNRCRAVAQQLYAQTETARATLFAR